MLGRSRKEAEGLWVGEADWRGLRASGCWGGAKRSLGAFMWQAPGRGANVLEREPPRGCGATHTQHPQGTGHAMARKQS